MRGQRAGRCTQTENRRGTPWRGGSVSPRARNERSEEEEIPCPRREKNHDYSKFVPTYIKSITLSIPRFRIWRLQQWSSGLRRQSATNRFLGLQVRNPLWAWKCILWVLSGRGLRDGLIPRPEKPYQLWRVWLNVIRKTSTWGGLDPRDLLSYKNNKR